MDNHLSTSKTFAALQHPNFRLWFIGQTVSLVGTWMQNTAQGYLVYQLTNSPAFLGYVGFAAGLPSWIFMLYGGVIADRISRRTMMMITQAAMMVLAFIMAGLVFTNVVQPWHIIVMAFLLGVANAFDAPARQSFVAELVDSQNMTNAIALNAMMFNLGAIVGPAAAGVAYAAFGPAWCFMINGFSFIAVIAALWRMKLKPFVREARTNSVLESLKDGLRYVRSQSLVQTLILSALVVNVFGFGMVTLIPAWASHVLNGDVRTNGLLLSFRGGGAVIGSLLIAAVSYRGIRGKLWGINSLILPVLMFLLAAFRVLPVSLVMLAGIGFALVNVMNNTNAMVQSTVPNTLRGRVMSLFTLMLMGGQPIGALLYGVLAEKLNEPISIYIGAAVLLIFAGFIWLRRPEIRAMR